MSHLTSDTTVKKPDTRSLAKQIQELSAQVRAQNNQVQKLLGKVVIWETTVLKPMAAYLQS